MLNMDAVAELHLAQPLISHFAPQEQTPASNFTPLHATTSQVTWTLAGGIAHAQAEVNRLQLADEKAKSVALANRVRELEEQLKQEKKAKKPAKTAHLPRQQLHRFQGTTYWTDLREDDRRHRRQPIEEAILSEFTTLPTGAVGADFTLHFSQDGKPKVAETFHFAAGPGKHKERPELIPARTSVGSIRAKCKAAQIPRTMDRSSNPGTTACGLCERYQYVFCPLMMHHLYSFTYAPNVHPGRLACRVAHWRRIHLRRRLARHAPGMGTDSSPDCGEKSARHAFRGHSCTSTIIRQARGHHALRDSACQLRSDAPSRRSSRG